nr:hypothetical protein [Tanacetum cinerariifolium]
AEAKVQSISSPVVYAGSDREHIDLDLLALAGLSVVFVACFRLFSYDLAGADMGAGCVNATGIEIDGLVDTLYDELPFPDIPGSM